MLQRNDGRPSKSAPISAQKGLNFGYLQLERKMNV